jgi:hypothetical protein
MQKEKADTSLLLVFIEELSALAAQIVCEWYTSQRVR